MPERWKIVVFGLSLTSSWGNGHATTYRALLHGLAELGHDILFCERDLPWYANNRDLPHPSFAQVQLYSSLAEAKRRLARRVRTADLVIVGSYVPEGIELGKWITSIAGGVTAFYDIDTPVTLTKLERDESDYISRSLVPLYDLYLSFTGGPTLRRIESKYSAHTARVLYCSVDSDRYFPCESNPKWDLGYMGTYSEDRQAALDSLMLEPARRWKQGRMVVAGPQYPKTIRWPSNVKRITHLSPNKHAAFYAAQRFCLNLTRSEMRAAGYSPSVRLFEAAACATPVITDAWEGLDELFLPGRDILVAESPQDTLRYLQEIPESERVAIGVNARLRVLRNHTFRHRALELQEYVADILHTHVPHVSSANDSTDNEPALQSVRFAQ
jgi:spore maturation protein CgeB